MSTFVNARGNRSCYRHIHCVPDGLHPMDTLEHLMALSREQLASIEKVRLAKEDLGPTLLFAVLPRIVREATVVSGPAWWAARTWAGMRELHGLTLVDVPNNVGPSTPTWSSRSSLRLGLPNRRCWPATPSRGSWLG